MQNLKAYFFIISCGIFLTIGDIGMKKWVVSKGIIFYIFGIIAYIIGVNFLAQSYLYRNIAIATTITNILNVVALSIISWFYFHDKLSSVQISGLILAIIAIVLLEWK